MPTHWNYPDTALVSELISIANTLVSSNKGVLLADESIDCLGIAFSKYDIENTAENRRRYRQLIFSCHRSINDYISGIVLDNETIYQKTDEGFLFIDVLKKKGIIPGVRVDLGPVAIYGTNFEYSVQGLDYLDKRCIAYKKDGCHFARWQCSFKIGENVPSYLAILQNTSVIARFASICQANRIVPVVEAEILSEGSHDMFRCQTVTETVLSFLMKALHDHNVLLDCVLVAINMTTPGASYTIPYATEEIANATVSSILRTVPTAVPGIMFLSGHQSDVEDTINLNAINNSSEKAPWCLAFCFGRTILGNVINIWKGVDQNERQAQTEILNKAKASSEAVEGIFVYEKSETDGNFIF